MHQSELFCFQRVQINARQKISKAQYSRGEKWVHTFEAGSLSLASMPGQ